MFTVSRFPLRNTIEASKRVIFKPELILIPINNFKVE